MTRARSRRTRDSKQQPHSRAPHPAGTTFHQSIGGGLSQSVRYLGKNGDGGHKFGCAGTYRGQQGASAGLEHLEAPEWSAGL